MIDVWVTRAALLRSEIAC